MSDRIFTARWNPDATKAGGKPAKATDSHVSATGRIIRQDGDLVTLLTAEGREVNVRSNWIRE